MNAAGSLQSPLVKLELWRASTTTCAFFMALGLSEADCDRFAQATKFTASLEPSARSA